jgi:hypothetical protein
MNTTALATGVLFAMAVGLAALVTYTLSRTVRESTLLKGFTIYTIGGCLFALPQLFIYQSYTTTSNETARQALIAAGVLAFLFALTLLYGTIAFRAPDSARELADTLAMVAFTPVRVVIRSALAAVRLGKLLKQLYRNDTPTAVLGTDATDASDSSSDGGATHTASDAGPGDDTPGTSTPDTTPGTGPTTPSTASDSPDDVSASLSQSPTATTDADIEDAITDTDSDRDAQLPPGHAADADTANQSPIGDDGDTTPNSTAHDDAATDTGDGAAALDTLNVSLGPDNTDDTDDTDDIGAAITSGSSDDTPDMFDATIPSTAADPAATRDTDTEKTEDPNETQATNDAADTGKETADTSPGPSAPTLDINIGPAPDSETSVDDAVTEHDPDTTIDINPLSDVEELMTGTTPPESPPEPAPERDESPSDTDDGPAHYGGFVFGE